MPIWSKNAALSRMKTNARLAEILRLEPRLEPIIRAAAQRSNGPGYDRIWAYRDLRDQSFSLVGWHAAHPDLRTMEDYDVVIRTIDDLLPPDDVDLYPDGKVKEGDD